MKKIYAFGDSNTYGFDPRMGGVGRYPKNIRWTNPVIVNESRKFGTVYEAIASEKGLKFLNASEWDLPLCYDGVHLTEEAHLHFAEKIISFAY